MSDKQVEHLALSRRATAEALGTAMLLMAVVGSGIMGELGFSLEGR